MSRVVTLIDIIVIIKAQTSPINSTLTEALASMWGVDLKILKPPILTIRGSIKRKRHRALSMFEDTIYNYNYMVNSKGKNS